MSTVEVENLISSKLESKEVAVYGVEIPGQEGKAGMATLTSSNVDIKQLGEEIKNALPSYAKPLFIRLAAEFDHTGKRRSFRFLNILNKVCIFNLFSKKDPLNRKK